MRQIPSVCNYQMGNCLSTCTKRSDGQSSESKPLTNTDPAANVGQISVVIKDGVQTTQPVRVQMVETVSIASQTDPVRIVSPRSSLFTINTNNNNRYVKDLSLSETSSDSDDDEISDKDPTMIVAGKTTPGTGTTATMWGLDHNNFDLDMSIYRSCRKLSVLPEEDNDECLNKQHSNSYSAKYTFKTQSADDVTTIEQRNNVRTKPVLSCSDIKFTTTTCSPPALRTKHSLPLEPNIVIKQEQSSPSSNELQLLDPKDAIRQPHSFDSYLDPQQIQNSSLSRQISDPTQNTVFASPVTRRGSYIKRPKSTCRPLTLPCNKTDEERKVRFDLTSTLLDNNKGPMSGSCLKNNSETNTRFVSRFRVDKVDECEFRKSITDETNRVRKRPPLIHSVVYKKSVLQDITCYDYDSIQEDKENAVEESYKIESPESPSYDTATESSPIDLCLEPEPANYLLADVYPCKRRKQSDVSDISQDDCYDIYSRSVRLHATGQCIIMKDLSNDESSYESDIPFIDDDNLPIIVHVDSYDTKTTQTDVCCFVDTLTTTQPLDVSPMYGTPPSTSPITTCSTFVTPTDDANMLSSPEKRCSLSKSPTVLKNLLNYPLIRQSTDSRKSLPSDSVDEDVEPSSETDSSYDTTDNTNKVSLVSSSSSSKEQSDNSETYATIKSDPSNLQIYSDDSDTYVTIRSESLLERKYSDRSENSNSPYNTPPDTSSASFCTPPDASSPVMDRTQHHLTSNSDNGSTRSPSPYYNRSQYSEPSTNSSLNYDTPPNLSPPAPASPYKTCSFYSYLRNDSLSDAESVTIYNIDDNNYPIETSDNIKRDDIIFDSPKLEFYESNDSIEKLEAFLENEEGTARSPTTSKQNSLEASEQKRKRHPLSRQNSTEDFNYLDPHESCLNLSEEISSPSTTPDTSNKTVIFKNKCLTVSNTIDLDDDDFPISESEIHINFNGSQAEILEIPIVVSECKTPTNYDMLSCRSEPCIPSIVSSHIDLTKLTKQSISLNDESIQTHEPFHLACPEIIVSNVSSDSEHSSSEQHGIVLDFPSNNSERSDINMSDVNTESSDYSRPQSTDPELPFSHHVIDIPYLPTTGFGNLTVVDLPPETEDIGGESNK